MRYTCVALLLLSGLVAPSSSSSASDAQHTQYTMAVGVAPMESALVGRIDRFEEVARRLTLQAKDGHVAFVLAADAVVRLGSRILVPHDLTMHRGRFAKVRFTLADGLRTAHWVVISSESGGPRGNSGA